MTDPDLSVQWLHSVLPNGGWVVVLCNAYFDESESHANVPVRVITVGGYLFEAGAAERFSKRAKRDLGELGLPFFHQTDCANEWGHYRGFGKSKCIRSQNLLIGNIKKRAIFGFACSINLAQYAEIVGKGRGIPTAYTYALAGATNAVRKWIDTHDYQGDIAYYYEDGATHKNDAARFLAAEMMSEENRRDYRCVSWGFADKKKIMPLAAADMISWYTNQEFTRVQRGLTERRRDFASLLRPQDRRIDHTPESLREFRQILEKHGRIAMGD